MEQNLKKSHKQQSYTYIFLVQNKLTEMRKRNAKKLNHMKGKCVKRYCFGNKIENDRIFRDWNDKRYLIFVCVYYN